MQACGHVCGSKDCHDEPPPPVAAYTPPLAPVSDLLPSVRRARPSKGDDAAPAGKVGSAVPVSLITVGGWCSSNVCVHGDAPLGTPCSGALAVSEDAVLRNHASLLRHS